MMIADVLLAVLVLLGLFEVCSTWRRDHPTPEEPMGRTSPGIAESVHAHAMAHPPSRRSPFPPRLDSVTLLLCDEDGQVRHEVQTQLQAVPEFYRYAEVTYRWHSYEGLTGVNWYRPEGDA